MTHSAKKKILLTMTALGLISLVYPKETSADGTSFSISPSTIFVQAKSPADVWTPFTIQNKNNQPVTFTIGYKSFDPAASQNGQVVFLPNSSPVPGVDKNIFQKMQVIDDNNISHDTVALGPKQSERLRLHIRLPKNEPTSDYYFSLLFLENTTQSDQNGSNNNIETQKSSSTLNAGIGLNVLLAIGNKETPQGAIETFSTVPFRESGPVPFTLSIHNYGDHFISPNGSILIKNMFGQAIGKISIPQSVVLSSTTRTFSNANLFLGLVNQNSLQNQTEPTDLQIIWPEYFLLGLYSATLTLSLSDQGPIFIRTIHFFAFPFRFFLGLLLIVAIILFIILRVKRKMV